MAVRGNSIPGGAGKRARGPQGREPTPGEDDPYWMDRERKASRRNFPPRRPSRVDRRRAEVMRDWLGELAAREILAHRRPAQPIGQIVHEVLGKYVRAQELTLTKIQRAWKDAVGAGIAGQAVPMEIRQKVLWIEVTNEAWRYNLERLMKPEILRVIQEIVGENAVRDLRFLPAGRRRQEGRGNRRPFRY